MAELSKRMFVGNGFDYRWVTNSILTSLIVVIKRIVFVKAGMRKDLLACQVSVYVDGKRYASIKFILKSSPSKVRSQSFVDFGAPSGAYKSLSSIIRHLNSYLYNGKTTKSTVKRLKYVLWR